MGFEWDGQIPSVEIWKECLRVLKPGGHLLSFAGTRTQHRMAVNIEDAGFEIRDMISWVYGSGFPKSHNISKAIDKMAGVKREVIGQNQVILNKQKKEFECGIRNVKSVMNKGAPERNNGFVTLSADITKPATPNAIQWEGWGTALKPAFEPITVARKPVSEKTIAKNVLKHGTGGINIDGCRIELNGDYKCKANGRPSQTGLSDNYNSEQANQQDTKGRFPANFIHDGSDEVEELFPNTKSGAIKKGTLAGTNNNLYGAYKGYKSEEFKKSEGSASRFFYCAKTSKTDRNEGLDDQLNNHPTVKPTKLMQYLVRLVTQPNGIVLDPFMGSGSTGKACKLEGFNFIGIDLDENYCEIAEARIKLAEISYKNEEIKKQNTLERFM